MEQTIGAAFLALLVGVTALRLWLARRQIRHVRAHRDALPPAFVGTIPPAAHRRAADYTVARTRLAAFETVVQAALVAALTVGGALALLWAAWSRLFAPGGLAHDLAFATSAFALVAAAELPFSAWRVFAIEERFGFNRTSVRLFFADLAKGAALAALLALPLLALALALARSGEPLWWLWAWTAWAAFNVALAFAYPVLIAPLFNRFSPLADAALAERIAALLARCGLRSERVLVMDGSRRSSHGNAFFAGLGRSRRVVLFDTLLVHLSADEVEAVLAHELGHDRLGHVRRRLALALAASLALAWALDQAVRSPAFAAGLGVPQGGEAAGFVLFLLAAPYALAVLAPLASAVSRRHEYEADAFAAAHADKRALARALVKLYRDNAATLTPDPLHSAVYDSHPPALARLARLAA